jgi:hypothetical protein
MATAQAVTIADFEKGAKPNNVGGDFGAWSKDPADTTQFCREGFDEANTRTGAGYCMKLDYDVDSPKAAYGGFWMKLGNLDASKAKKLTFWAKGDDKKGCTTSVKVELKSADGEKGTAEATNIGTSWTKIEIPLGQFNVSDLTSLSEMVFVFDDINSLPKEGVMFIDDISIE